MSTFRASAGISGDWDIACPALPCLIQSIQGNPAKCINHVHFRIAIIIAEVNTTKVEPEAAITG